MEQTIVWNLIARTKLLKGAIYLIRGYEIDEGQIAQVLLMKRWEGDHFIGCNNVVIERVAQVTNGIRLP